MEVVLGTKRTHRPILSGTASSSISDTQVAHEDAAHRAVRAALGIVAAMETLNPYLHTTFGVEISVRLSIDTGLVVVWHISDEGSPEAIDIVGKTPNHRSENAETRSTEHYCDW